MAALRPVAFYGLNVPAGEEPVPAMDGHQSDYPASFRITMAAIDPFVKPVEMSNGAPTPFTGATLRIIRVPTGDDSEGSDSEDDDDEELARMLNGGASDDSEASEDDEEINGGPSDPEKSPKALKRAQRIQQALLEDDADEDMDVDGAGIESLAKEKGKGPALSLSEDEEDSEDEDGLDLAEEYVVCTLDVSKNYQQPLDITLHEFETIFFQVSGTHDVYLTGNLLEPESDDLYDPDEDEAEDEFDLPPDDDELDLPDDEDESDELDDLEDPRAKASRITELGSDDDEIAPKLVEAKANQKKGKNKRPADSSEDDLPTKAGIDSILAKSIKPPEASAPAVNGEGAKLSKAEKKQRKKMRNNAGEAIDTTVAATTVTSMGGEDLGIKETEQVTKQSPGKTDKKVQFAKTLVQGPSGSPISNVNGAKPAASDSKVPDAKASGGKPNKASMGVKDVQGVTLDDRKVGSGPTAKIGDKVSMRYIGKLQKGDKVFDSNKKGPPFQFQIGSAKVIKGWSIGVAGMSIGGERRITVPPHLAYGHKALPDIPANSTLVFDLKLLDIK